MLSKSLPATLPSHLPYSDDSEIEGNYSSNSLKESRHEDESYPMNRSNRSNRSVTLERAQPSPYQQRVSASTREKTQPQSSNALRSIFIALIVIIAVMVRWKFPNLITSISNNLHDKSTQTENHHDIIIFENNMKTLQKKYNIDDNSILKLKTGK